MTQVYIAVWFFLITLDSFYSYSFNISVPPVVAGVVSFFCLPFIIVKIKKNDLLKIKYLLALIFYVIFFGLSASLVFDEIYYSRMLAPTLFFSVIVNTLYFAVNHRECFYKGVLCALFLHLFAFYLQVASHYIGFGYIDYLYSVTGESQRAFGGSYSSDIFGAAGFIRPTGLFNEPGTYATMIFLVFLFEQALGSLLNKKNNHWLIFLTLFSIFLSFSVFGMLFLAIYLLYLSSKNKYYIIPIAIFCLIAIPVAFDVYIYPRFLSGNYSENGWDFRFSAMFDYFDYVVNNLWIVFFGFGFFTNFSNLIGPYVWADLGLFFYSIVIFGIFGNILLMLTLFGKFSFYNQVFILSVIFLLSKTQITSMFFWVILSGISYLVNSKKLNPII